MGCPSGQMQMKMKPVSQLGGRGWRGGILALIVFVFGSAFSNEGDVGSPVALVSVEDVMSGRVTTAFKPEYDRGLENVLLSLHSVADRAWMETNLRAVALLPLYTSVLMIVPKSCTPEQLSGVQSVIDQHPGKGGSRMVTCAFAEQWAQDVGEGSMESFMIGGKGRRIAGQLAELGVQARLHYLPLDGGNIHLARNAEGRRFVMVGSEEYEAALGEFEGRETVEGARVIVRDSYRKTFGADELLVLPNLPGAHIDQVVLCLRDGVVATEVLPDAGASERRLFVNFLAEWANAESIGLTEPIELYPAEYRGDTRRVTFDSRDGRSTEVPLTRYMTKEQKEIFLRYRSDCPHLNDLLYTSEYRRNRLSIERILIEKGFEIVHLRTSVWHTLNRQTYVNAVPYRDAETGRPAVLLPVYRNPGTPEQSIDLSDLRGLNYENTEYLRALGYDVVPVPSHVQLGGNLHCSLFQF